jgi:hypothetical protein
VAAPAAAAAAAVAMGITAWRAYLRISIGVVRIEFNRSFLFLCSSLRIVVSEFESWL